MTDQEDLFGAPRQEPEAPRKAEKKGPLKEKVLEKFKARKFQSFTREQVVASFPRRRPDVVERALMKLIKEGDVKVLLTLGVSDSIRYTATIYKS